MLEVDGFGFRVVVGDEAVHGHCNPCSAAGMPGLGPGCRVSVAVAGPAFGCAAEDTDEHPAAPQPAHRTLDHTYERNMLQSNAIERRSQQKAPHTWTRDTTEHTAADATAPSTTAPGSRRSNATTSTTTTGPPAPHPLRRSKPRVCPHLPSSRSHALRIFALPEPSTGPFLLRIFPAKGRTRTMRLRPSSVEVSVAGIR